MLCFLRAFSYYSGLCHLTSPLGQKRITDQLIWIQDFPHACQPLWSDDYHKSYNNKYLLLYYNRTCISWSHISPSVTSQHPRCDLRILRYGRTDLHSHPLLHRRSEFNLVKATINLDWLERSPGIPHSTHSSSSICIKLLILPAKVLSG